MEKILEKTNWKILNMLRQTNPQSWWREYPPEILYLDKPINFNKNTVKRYLKEIFSSGNDEPVGIYVHLPFCSSRCSFCKFYSVVINNENKYLIDDYLKALEKEIVSLKTDFRKKKIDNIYIGGGTPTLLNKSQWERLMKILSKYFVFKKNMQIATEGSPQTIDYSQAKLLKEIGVNRVTLGAQSFDDKILELSGRQRTSRDIYKAFFDLKKVGVPVVNFDFIFGFPGADKKSYWRTLEGILFLKPERVSIYVLDIGKGVQLYQKSGHFSEKIEPDIYKHFYTSLAKNGYGLDDKGIPGFFLLKKGREKTANRNLLLRWGFNSVLGIGCAAESNLIIKSRNGLRMLRYVKTSDLGKYLDNQNKNYWPPFWGRELNEDESLRRYLIYRLFYWRGTLNKKDFFIKFKKEAPDVLKSHFPALYSPRFISETKEDIFITFLQRTFLNSFFPAYSYIEHFFLFALKYLFSQKTLKQCQKLSAHFHDKNKK